jgi:uncharacterized membrane protein
MKAPIATLMAVISGLIVLLAYFLPIPALRDVSHVIINWAVTLSGVAMIVAVSSLVSAHWQKFRQKRNADRFSILVIFGFLITFLFGLVTGGPGVPAFQKIVTHFILPIEAGLMGALAAGLIYAGFRLNRAKHGWMTLVFGISTILFLLLYSGIFTSGVDIPIVKEGLGILQRLPDAGGRGIIIGLALGTVAAGVRILLGVDRPYSR